MVDTVCGHDLGVEAGTVRAAGATVDEMADGLIVPMRCFAIVVLIAL